MLSALYGRYSSDNQRTESIDAQRRAIMEYCERKGHTIYKEYIDEATTGTRDDREAFLEMIDDACENKFECIIVHKLDRFARNKYDSAIYRKLLEEKGITLISVIEDFGDSPEAQYMYSLFEANSDYFSRNLSREIKKGLKENSLKCIHNGGIPPLGYDVGEDRRYVINPCEAASVRMIFDLYLMGYGYASIADRLNELGYRTKRGGKFVKNSIRDILINEKYIGTYVFGKEDRHRKVKGKKKEQQIRIENGLPAIVDKDVFEAVQRKINAVHKPRRGITKARYLLSSKVVCGVCGYSYTGAGSYLDRKQMPVHNYRCVGRNSRGTDCKNPSMAQHLLEEVVLAGIKESILNDAMIDKLARQMEEMSADVFEENEVKMETLAKNAKDIQTQLDRLMDLYLRGKFPVEQIEAKSAELETQLATIKNEMGNIKVKDKKAYTYDNIVSYLNGFKEKLNSADEDVLFTVVDTFVDRIVMYPDTIEITYNVDVCDKVLHTKGYLTFSQTYKRLVHRTYIA